VAHETLTSALLAFHEDAAGLDLAKNRSGHVAEYLDLDKAMGQIRPLLTKHGLLVSHSVGVLDDGATRFYCRTRVIHAASGDSLDSGNFPLKPTKDDAQGWGAALTYARRYTLLAVLALVADNDDDGAGAPARGGGRRQPKAVGRISAKQRRELMDAIRDSGIPTDRGAAIVKEVAGVDSSADIPSAKFADVLRAVKKAKA